MDPTISRRLSEVASHSRSAKGILDLVAKMDPDRIGNLNKIRRSLERLDSDIAALATETGLAADLKAGLASYRSALEASQQAADNDLGSALARELSGIGLTLRGQYPELKVGLFTVEIAFESRAAVLWFGPKQERVASCPLVVGSIAKAIGGARSALGSGLDATEFAALVNQAFEMTARGSKTVEALPLTQLLPVVALLVQPQRFAQDPRKEMYRSYSRADFGYDLYRARAGIRLRVAVRALTRKRRDFLWVPSDEAGDGTAYSHMERRRS